MPALLAVALLLTQQVLGDLPVHCLRHQLYGDWEFTLSGVGGKRLPCGHQHPDSPDHQPPVQSLDSMSPGAVTTRKVRLVQPDTAFDDSGKKGSWTMIYDEGFEVSVGDEVFFAFSRFDWVTGPSGRTNVSQCNHTQIGWYRNLARTKWGCYVGRKVGSTDEEANANIARALAVQLTQASQAASQVQDQDDAHAEEQAVQATQASQVAPRAQDPDDPPVSSARSTTSLQDPIQEVPDLQPSTTTEDAFAQQQAAFVQAAAQAAAAESTQDASPNPEVEPATDVESTSTALEVVTTTETSAVESTTEASMEAFTEASATEDSVTEASTTEASPTDDFATEDSATEASTTEASATEISATEDSATGADGTMAAAAETTTTTPESQGDEDPRLKSGESRLLAVLQAADDGSNDDDDATTTTTTTTTTTAEALQGDSMGDATDVSKESSEAAPAAGASLGQISLASVYNAPTAYKAWRPNGGQGYDQPMDKSVASTIADALNFLQLGWTAVSYDRYHGKTPREMNRLAGVRRGRSERASGAAAGAESFLSIRTRHRVRRHGHGHRDVSSFDWRSKDGQNWLTPVVTQGDCGSCYTISTVHMLTARNKIRAGKASGPLFSVSFPLYCAEYNQGCDGGYGFLQSKWSEDVGLVPEECAPFSEGGGQCGVTKECKLGSKRYRAVNHHYVGGFYGGGDQESIKQELLHGPVVMSFEPSEDFMYYKSGVYRSGPHKIHQEWEQVDHAVLLIAFGTDDKKPYWTMQNSWGADWGEEGYFRMARGIDESACESIVVSADVAEEDSNSVLDDFVEQLKGN